jgi:hypothetical protein
MFLPFDHSSVAATTELLDDWARQLDLRVLPRRGLLRRV